MDITIQHDVDAQRFYCSVEGHEAELTYRVQDARMVIDHTGVPQAIGGRGIAAQLVRTALGYARMRQWRVTPACSYAAAYIERHPEYVDLLA